MLPQEAYLSASNTNSSNISSPSLSSLSATSVSSSESDTTPSSSPAGRRLFRSRYKKNKNKNNKSNKKRNFKNKQKREKNPNKTILIFLGKPKSKSTFNLFGNKSRGKYHNISQSLSSPNLIMSSHVNSLKAQFESKKTVHSNASYSPHSQHHHQHQKPPPSPNSISSQINQFNNNNNNNNSNNRVMSESVYINGNIPPSSPVNVGSFSRSHMKSQSHITLPSHQQIRIRSKSPNHKDTSQYTGLCPYCNKEMPLLEFLTVSNKNSVLTELRDKLSTIEALASILKQQILAEQRKSKSQNHSGLGGSNSNSDRNNIGNPYQEDTAGAYSNYHLTNLTSQQQQALALLSTHKNITFGIVGVAMISPQDSMSSTSQYFEKFKEMRRKYTSSDFYVRLDSSSATLTVHTKDSSKNKKDSGKIKQYRQSRSFSSLNGAEFESAKDNVLKIWFKNTRGYYLMSFVSETEAQTILNLINIIVNNDDYNQDIGSSQLCWSGYVQKKGKRMGLYSQKYLALIKLDIKLYKTHTNYANGEQPSLRFSLLNCDLARDKKEVKFKRRLPSGSDNDNNKSFLCIKLPSEVERDDFLNLCAQTLGEAIRSQSNQSKLLKGSSPIVINNGGGGLPHVNDLEYESDIEESQYFEDEKEFEYSKHGRDHSFDGVDNIDVGNSNSNNHIFGKSMTLRGNMTPGAFNKHSRDRMKYKLYLESLNSTPRMYSASSLKALRRLANRRPSDIDFIESQFKGNEIQMKSNKNGDEYLMTYQLLDVLGKSMISGAFLNQSLYLHKAIWEQNKITVTNYDEKLEVFNSMLFGLNKLLNDSDCTIDWLSSSFTNNSNKFLNKLLECELSLRESQSSLVNFLNKSESKTKKKGISKFVGKLQEKSRMKVFDNEPYRDLIFKICGHASSLEIYYRYLLKITSSRANKLLKEIKGITLCMMSFARVIVGDIKEFLCTYLKRGAKNIYQYQS